jgi:hypothetical protein
MGAQVVAEAEGDMCVVDVDLLEAGGDVSDTGAVLEEEPVHEVDATDEVGVAAGVDWVGVDTTDEIETTW